MKSKLGHYRGRVLLQFAQGRSCAVCRDAHVGTAALGCPSSAARQPRHLLRHQLTLCTVPAAVISSLLDRSLLRVLNGCSRKENPAEDFHTTKKFVLLCRTVPAFKFSFILVIAQRKNGRFPQQTRDSI